MRVNKRKLLQEQALQAWSNYKGKDKGPWKEHKFNTNQNHQDQEFGKTSESSKGRRKDQAQKEGCSSKNSKEWKFDKRKMRCHNFQKLGHYARECWTRKGAKNKPKIHANLAQDEGSDLDSETMMLLATTSSATSNETSYLDYGCSTHMTGKSLTVEGTNKVVFRNTDRKETIIEEVLYVPSIKTNMLSLGQLLQKGFVMKMANNCLTVLDRKQNLLSQNRTFQVRMHYLQHQCLTTLENKKEWLWHLKFCHLNFKDLHLLANHKMVKGLPQVLVLEATSRNNNIIVPTTTTKKLQVIHSDVCGPMQIETPEGNWYFIYFIDDLTKKIWHSGKMIKVLRTEGEREYMSTSVGLIHENIPHHSGTVERRNITLLN
ncbi:hypothetical protein CR513_24476, partial [Mucuna pruriens]